MAKATLEKEACVNCGADIRPDTQFCYSCGKDLFPSATADGGEAEPVEQDEVLADLEKALAASRTAPGDSKAKIDAAASERRRSRIGQRKPLEIVWEPSSEISWVYLVSVGVIFVLVLLTVLMVVFWK